MKHFFLSMALLASFGATIQAQEKPEIQLETIAEGELRVDGKITGILGVGQWSVQIISWTSPRGVTTDFDVPKNKTVKVMAGAFIHPRGEAEKVDLKEIKLNTRVGVIGKNGAGGVLEAREIVLLEGFGKTKMIGRVIVNPFTSQLITQARAANDGGQSAKAISLINQAVSAAQGVQDKTGEAFALHELGNVYSDLEQYDKALESYNRVISIARVQGDKDAEAGALNGVGLIYLNTDKYPEAIDALEKADQAGTQSEVAARVLFLGNLVGAYRGAGRDKDAASVLRRLFPLEEEAGEYDDATDSLLTLAEILAKEKPEEARQFLAQAKPRIEKARDEKSKANLLASQGMAQSGLGDKDAARKSWEDAAKLFEAQGEPEAAKAMREMMAKSQKTDKPAE